MEKIKKTSLYLPADLMKRLKIYCIQEEKTMTAVLQEAIEAFVCRKENLPRNVRKARCSDVNLPLRHDIFATRTDWPKFNF